MAILIGVLLPSRRPVHGSDAVARFLLGVLGKRPGAEISEQETDDGLAFAVWEEGRIIGVVNLAVVDSAVADVWIVMNPSKLTMWA